MTEDFNSPADAAKMKLREALMLRIQAHVRSLNMTQVEAAKICKVSQPRLNLLLNSKISTFSTDALINIAFAAGLQVDLAVKESASHGYKPSFVTTCDGDTFTAKELKEMLAGEDDDQPVYIYLTQTGHTYAIQSGSYGRFINGKEHKDGGYAELLAFEPRRYPLEKRE